MQIDMHYYGTYAMARAAGISAQAANVIATAAQYVDDNATKEFVLVEDGARLDVHATAHHTLDARNIDPEDQRNIWVPFHFMPGNEGEEYTERLVCRKNSEIAQEMVAHNIATVDVPYMLELVGITAHVYADTFSHYGFSGVSSRRNRVINDSFTFPEMDDDTQNYARNKMKDFKKKYGKEGGFLANIKSWLAEGASGALGHGAVTTFPDLPYLKWSFEYEYPDVDRITRDNPQTFAEGCQALHGMFRDFLNRYPEYSDNDGKDFGSIHDRIADIIDTRDGRTGRIAQWQTAAGGGDLFAGAGEAIPSYNEETWHKELISLHELKDSRLITKFSVYRFYQAASAHKNYVLRDLLPKYDLVVN